MASKHSDEVRKGRKRSRSCSTRLRRSSLKLPPPSQGWRTRKGAQKEVVAERSDRLACQMPKGLIFRIILDCIYFRHAKPISKIMDLRERERGVKPPLWDRLLVRNWPGSTWRLDNREPCTLAGPTGHPLCGMVGSITCMLHHRAKKAWKSDRKMSNVKKKGLICRLF